MKGKKNFILASLACLSVFGGSVKAMQRSHSAPRMIVRNDEMVSGDEFNQSMKTANMRGAIGTLLGAATGAGVSWAITYSHMNKDVKELKDKVDKLTKENEELKKQLDEKDNGHPVAPLGDAEKDAEIKKLKDKNETLLVACKEYQKSIDKFFENLHEKTKHIKSSSHMLYVNMPDLDSITKIDEAIKNITDKYNDKTLTKDLSNLKSKVHEEIDVIHKYVYDGVNDMKLEELFDGPVAENVDGGNFAMLTKGIITELYHGYHIDLDKD